MADPEHTPPDAARKAFERQKLNAWRRGIPFLLTFEAWWEWWQIDNRWAQRGRQKGDLVMARVGDVGPYALDNIYCSTAIENWRVGVKTAPGSIAKAIETRRKTDDYAHLRNRTVHPKRRPVVSPKGTFPSIVLAAEANGLKPAYAQKLASKGTKGWGYTS